MARLISVLFAECPINGGGDLCAATTMAAGREQFSVSAGRRAASRGHTRHISTNTRQKC